MSRTSPNLELRKAPFDSDKENIYSLISEGYSDQHIAEIYSVTRDTLWCRRQRWGFKSGCEIKEEKLKSDMTELWKNGYTVNEIAKVLDISLQVIYTKMRLYKIRSISRMGIEAVNMSLTEIRQAVSSGKITDDDLVVVNHSRLPKWVLVPIEQYQDLIAGVFQELRNK
jgi:hypothetical protein